MHSGNAHGAGSGDGSSDGRSRRCIRRPPRTCARANGDQRGRVHEAVRGTSARSYRRMGSLKRADVHSRRLCTLECCSTSSACRSASPFAPVHATPWARRESMIFCVALAEGGWCTWTLHASREAGCRARLRWSARQPERSITYQACRYSARTRGQPQVLMCVSSRPKVTFEDQRRRRLRRQHHLAQRQSARTGLD